MTYGILVQNANGHVQLDDVTQRYAVVATGFNTYYQVGTTSDFNAITYTEMPAGLNAPMLLVRTPVGIGMRLERTSATNYALTSFTPAGTYEYAIIDTKASSWIIDPSSSHGLLVNNSSGTRVFDSRAKIAHIDLSTTHYLTKGSAITTFGGPPAFGRRFYAPIAGYLGINSMGGGLVSVICPGFSMTSSDEVQVSSATRYFGASSYPAETVSGYYNIILGSIP